SPWPTSFPGCTAARRCARPRCRWSSSRWGSPASALSTPCCTRSRIVRMPKRREAPDLESLADQMRRQQEALGRALPGDGAQRQVMAGCAEAYRAWLEAMSAKPESLVELQTRFMQEQMRLWTEAMQGAPTDDPDEPADKRFAGAEWNELPMFRYLRDSYLST